MRLHYATVCVCLVLLLALAWLVNATCLHPAPHEQNPHATASH